MSFLSSSLSSSSLSSSSSTSPLQSRRVSPTCLPTYAVHSLYAAILADPVILRVVEDLPLYEEDVICQELVRLFHDVSTTQRYHHLASPNDLPAEFGIPLRMSISALPQRVLNILNLHGFHVFVSMLPPAVIYPTFRRVYLSMTMEECDRYVETSQLPSPRSPSPIPVPPPSNSAPSLISRLSSPPPSSTSSSPTAVNSELGLDEDMVELNQSFMVRVGNDRPVLSAPTRLVHVPIRRLPASTLTECFRCRRRGHYREDCPNYVCPNCHVSAPGHPQASCLTIQCDFCSRWGHGARFCPTRLCGLCNTGGHVADDCAFAHLSIPQATHIFGSPSNSGQEFA
jgi:hypothetical protein